MGKQQVREKVMESTQTPLEECKHYWVIESADGSTSEGWCKSCGARREFFNSLPDAIVVRRNTSFLNMPELEADKKQNRS